MLPPRSDSPSAGPVLRAYAAATPGAAGDGDGRRWQRAAPVRSQVLQGFLSLLCVPVVAVGVGPLAAGLRDGHDPRRVGQTLLVAGEEAKPSGRKARGERPPRGVPRTPVSAAPGTNGRHAWRGGEERGADQAQAWKRTLGGCGSQVIPESSRGCRASPSRNPGGDGANGACACVCDV